MPARLEPLVAPVPAPTPHGVQGRSPASATTYPSLVHAAPSRPTLLVARAAPLVVAALWAAFVVHTLVNRLPTLDGPGQVTLMVVTLVATTALCFSSAMYLLGRAGGLLRIREHRRATRAELDGGFRLDEPSMTVLVPSYAEEPRVVAATLWSAALQEFPTLRVVLLIDDKPFPTDPAARARLDETRRLPGAIATALAEPHGLCVRALEEFQTASNPGVTDTEVQRLVDAYDRAVSWLQDLAARQEVIDHADTFLVDQVFLALAEELRAEADELRSRIIAEDLPGPVELLDAHRRLVRIFATDLDSFERKRYISLSHEANKAMNLNSYLALMGRSWRIETTADGDVLTPAGPGEPADLVVPHADFLLTLDADSLLMRDYCVRLVHELRRPGNEDVAVIQTPYCSFPGAPTMVERIAGATTDLQHLHHLGKTHFDATFWVGANAIIRREALDDIVTTSVERGFEIRTYIQDRTVIEDTESSMDLAARGWRLENYPERLSYSATPPDFGTLVVQRRRWANGGLIILPKIAEVIRGRRARGQRLRVGEVALRVDYLGSIAWTTIAAPLLMLVPAVGQLLSPWLFLTAVPFLLAQASDLRRVGHRPLDVVWVQALNLVLVPVNLAGVLKSLQQAATGRKIPFARTPKIADRVAAPALFVLLPYAGVVVLGLLVARAVAGGFWLGAGFAGVACLLMLVGSVTFVGVRGATQDVAAALGWRPRKVRELESGSASETALA